MIVSNSHWNKWNSPVRSYPQNFHHNARVREIDEKRLLFTTMTLYSKNKLIQNNIQEICILP